MQGFRTSCACCGTRLFLSKIQKERLDSKGQAPLCFDCRGEQDTLSLSRVDFEPVSNGHLFQHRLPIEAIAGECH